MTRRAEALLGLIFFVACITSWGWNDHFRITKAAVDSLEVAKETVPFEPLEAVLTAGHLAGGVKNQQALLRFLKINTHTIFPLKLKEASGAKVRVGDVLAIYSDEPDWGMDRNLFSDDQYPELWTPDLKYVCQREGIMSQGFRHMYFPGRFWWTEPVSSIQIPMRPLGEAPTRAALYYELATGLLKSGHPYWGYRFLAWSLHLLADLYQPFHARQTPSKRFIRIQWKGILPSFDIPKTAQQIAYYHFSFETWLAKRMEAPNSLLAEALGKRVAPPGTAITNVRGHLENTVVDTSAGYATRLGDLCYRSFPPFSGDHAEQFVGKDAWWGQIRPDVENLELLAIEIFSKMGEELRQLVFAATGKTEPLR